MCPDDLERYAPAVLPSSPPPDWSLDSVSLAERLIGASLLVDGVGGVIVETEAYRADDAASHSHRGPTRANAAMFGPPGRAYVYRSYGVHWCLNFVCSDHDGSGVLIRALEPLWGLDVMARRRGTAEPRLLCSGPGRLTQALGVTYAHNGLPLEEPPFLVASPQRPAAVATCTRIGISREAHKPWRFLMEGSPFVSRPVRRT